MIFTYKQISRTPETKHEILVGDEVIATSTCPHYHAGILQTKDGVFSMNIENLAGYEIEKDRLPFAYTKIDLVPTKKFLGIKIGYEFYNYLSSEHEIHIFEIGLGAGHHYWYLYDEDILVAVIHKKDEVRMYLDEYTCYLIDEKYFDVTALYCLFLESTVYYNHCLMDEPQINDTSLYSSQKQLRAKYDPNFIPKIMEMEKEKNKK